MNEEEGVDGLLHEAAVVTHEMFLAYIKAGFSEDQAIKIIIGLMAANKPVIFPPPSPNGRVN